MAHYAKILNDTVIEVRCVEDNYFETFIDNSPGTWIETFQDGSQRGKFAGIGDIYNSDNDEFRPQKPPYESWVWNSELYKWVAPIDYPTDGNRYSWNEETTSWTQLDPQ
tara:strand:+ start:344 stop:670 length:327 start_codon:yes stop_codon:yes gene_type:complete